MEVMYFIDARFREIPEQDNPVFDTTTYSGTKKRVNECILVCKVADVEHSGVGDGFSVIHIPYEGEITSKGRFWNIGNATIFAEALVEYYKLRPPIEHR